MNFDQSILKNDEKAIFALRSLYQGKGYRRFRMSKFEEYDLYSANKEMLVSEGVITFTDTDGRLMALKPDVTLSIIKNSLAESKKVEKFYYNENVYRISGDSHSYKEIMQTGVECIGDIGECHIKEVVLLAAESLSEICDDYRLCISDVALVEGILCDNGIEKALHPQVLAALEDKNFNMPEGIFDEEKLSVISKLFAVGKTNAELIEDIRSISKSEATLARVELLGRILNTLDDTFAGKAMLDLSVTSIGGYYSGVVFKGYANGIASKVLSGGQYDKLLKRMGKNASAIGFAVYLDTLDRRMDGDEASVDKTFINVALPKGRLGEKVYDMFEKAGFDCPSIKENNRKLVFENDEVGIRFFWVKPSDVAIYVERGAADIGVVGKDILLEYSPDVYELLDMNIGKCRMAVAAKKDFHDDDSKVLKVATKFSNVAKKYYGERSRDIDIIHLNGSIELAPILGLSDVIVDIVETGKTLLENDLVPYETIFKISARLVSNKASYSFKTEKIEKIRKALALQVIKNDD